MIVPLKDTISLYLLCNGLFILEKYSIEHNKGENSLKLLEKYSMATGQSESRDTPLRADI
jgi:hypothetical protein